MRSEGLTESSSIAVFRKSRILVILGIATLSMMAWGYMVYLGSDAASDYTASHHAQYHQSTNFLFIFVMWSVMMVAMMVPSAAPTIIMFDTIVQRKIKKKYRFSPTIIFVAGYLTAWTVYSCLAAIAQLWMQNSALISTTMSKSAPIVSGILLIIAGLFQFSSLKYACLKHCRSPVGFFILHWQDGHKGALEMGLRSGMYCVGCCWAIMVLMFVVGVMNIIWMAVLAVFILAEKLIPWGRRFSQVSGIFFIAWGIWVFFHL
jgi:predicted metal-binding membrane protein